MQVECLKDRIEPMVAIDRRKLDAQAQIDLRVGMLRDRPREVGCHGTRALERLFGQLRKQRLLAFGVRELDRARQDVDVLVRLTRLAAAFLDSFDDEEGIVSLGEDTLALDDLGTAHVRTHGKALADKFIKRIVNVVNDFCLFFKIHDVSSSSYITSGTQTMRAIVARWSRFVIFLARYLQFFANAP